MRPASSTPTPHRAVRACSSPLVIYTASTKYALDTAAWTTITQVAAGKKRHVRIRSAVVTGGQRTAGPFLGTEGDIEIAPVDASGTVVYWTTSGGTVLKGFKIGDESVQPVITPAQANTACVACHSSTPDGKYIGLSASQNINDGSGSAYVDIRTVMEPGASRPFCPRARRPCSPVSIRTRRRSAGEVACARRAPNAALPTLR